MNRGPINMRTSRPATDERAAVARLALALAHTLRLVRLAAVHVRFPDTADELLSLERGVEQATLPEEYAEVSVRVRQLRAPAPIAVPGLPPGLVQKLARRIIALARGLELKELETDLLREVEQDDTSLESLERVLCCVDRAARAAAAFQGAFANVNGAIETVATSVEQVLSVEAGTATRLRVLRAEIGAVNAQADLDTARSALLAHSTELEATLAERSHALREMETATTAARAKLSRLAAEVAEATQSALTDPLTGLGNRRALDAAARATAALTAACSVLVLDIDHFKRVNDTHGHGVGDTVLTEVARRVRNTLRDTDGAFRIGGEEFVGLLPHTNGDQAMRVAERLRERVGSSPIDIGGLRLTVTVSIGFTEWAGGVSFERTLASADAALYEAKRGGRNASRRASPGR